MSSWQSIATAPKGVKIFLWTKGFDPSVGKLTGQYEWYAGRLVASPPTHWLPIPPPPVDPAAGLDCDEALEDSQAPGGPAAEIDTA